MSKLTDKLTVRNELVCPWWFAWTFDNPLRRFLHNPQELLGPYVHEGMVVADIGCGMGYFTRSMANMVGQTGLVLAIDLQQKMLDICCRRARRAGVIDHIRAVRASTEDIMIRERVDFVLAFWMVHEVKDIPRFFDQVVSVLEPSGKMLCAEPWMHVTQKRFEEIVGCARSAGLQVSATPLVRFSRAVLLVRSR